MPKCKICEKELSRKQKSTCSVSCKGEYVSTINKGKPSPFKGMIGRYTEEQRLKISNSQRGKPKSLAFREKCRARMKGSAFFKGKKHTETTKEMMKAKMGGTLHWNYGKGVNAKHGQARNGKNTSEYRCWVSIKQRCYNKNMPSYKHYGGRGITVCERWRAGFKNFFDDMGEKPNEKYSMDRIDNDGNYDPNNCRWASRKQQFDNNRLTRGNDGRFLTA